MTEEEPTCTIRKSVNEYNQDYPVFIPYAPDHTFVILKTLEKNKTRTVVEVLFDGKPAITQFYHSSVLNQEIISADNAICLWNAASLFGIAPKILDHSFCEKSNQLFFITYENIPHTISLSSFFRNLLEKNNVPTMEIFPVIADVLILLFSKVLLLLFKARVHSDHWFISDFLVEEEGGKIKNIYYTNFGDEYTSSYNEEDIRRYKDVKKGMDVQGDAAIPLNLIQYFVSFFDSLLTEIASGKKTSLSSFMENAIEFIKKKIVGNPFDFAPDDFLENEKETNKKLIGGVRSFGNVLREILSSFTKTDTETFLKSPLSKHISTTVGSIVAKINSSGYSMYNNIMSFSNCSRYALKDFISKSSYPKMEEVPFNIPAKIAIIRIEKDEENYKQYLVYFNDKKGRMITKKTNSADAKSYDAPAIYAWYLASLHHLTPTILSYFFCGSWTYTESYSFVYEYDESSISLENYLTQLFLTDYVSLYKDNDHAYFSEMIRSYRTIMQVYRNTVEMVLLASCQLSAPFSLSYIFVQHPKSEHPRIQFHFLEDGIAPLSRFHLLTKEGGYSTAIPGMDDDHAILLKNQRSFLEELSEYLEKLSSKNIFVLILECFIKELKENITHRGYLHLLKDANKDSISRYIENLKNCLKSVTAKALKLEDHSSFISF